jgi:hypothetical protein
VKASNWNVAFTASVAKNGTTCFKDEEAILIVQVLSVQEPDRAFLTEHACPMLIKTTGAQQRQLTNVDVEILCTCAPHQRMWSTVERRMWLRIVP